MNRGSWWFLGRFFAGAVFAFAGYSKLLEPVANFRGAIAQYGVIPYPLVSPLAHVLPWLEFLFGVFLILGYMTRVSALVISFLSLGFLLILGSSNALLEAGSKDCGCFGQSGWIHFTVHQIFFIDLVNFFLALKIYSLPEQPFSLDRWLSKKK